MLERHTAEKGMLVQYTADNAFPFEIEQASKLLKKGKNYTISDIYKDIWGCYIYLEGVPDKSFKCFMFNDVGLYVHEEPVKTAKVKTVKAPKKK
jgi:hypothetical protein